MLASSLASHAQVGIGTSSPNASSVLDLSSTTKGFLPPRLTTAERDLIDPVTVGLVIFNTTTNCLNFYGGAWIEACGTGRYPSSSVICDQNGEGGYKAVVDVTNTATGRIWMDRNLGAQSVHAAVGSQGSYGDLYQWGRRSDEHQCGYSTTTTLSSVDQPANGHFITINSGNNDWRSPQNDNLWQGVYGVNNPCPSGYRIPTEIEWEAERLSWSTNDAAGAFASPLKLPLAGTRLASTASPISGGTYGRYWSSTVSGTSSRSLVFDSSINSASMSSISRAHGLSVRCIKN